MSCGCDGYAVACGCGPKGIADPKGESPVHVPLLLAENVPYEVANSRPGGVLLAVGADVAMSSGPDEWRSGPGESPRGLMTSDAPPRDRRRRSVYPPRPDKDDCTGPCGSSKVMSDLKYLRGMKYTNDDIDVMVADYCKSKDAKQMALMAEGAASDGASRHCTPLGKCVCDGTPTPICNWALVSQGSADDLADGFMPQGGNRGSSGARNTGLQAAAPLDAKDPDVAEEDRVYIQIEYGFAVRGECDRRKPKKLK